MDLTLTSTLEVAEPVVRNSVTAVTEANRLMFGLYTVYSRKMARVFRSSQFCARARLMILSVRQKSRLVRIT